MDMVYRDMKIKTLLPHAVAGLLMDVSGTGQVGFSLCQAQTKLGIFDDDQRVAPFYFLEFLETNFPNETLHASILGGNVLANTGVVGKFHVPEVYELHDYNGCACQEAAYNYTVVNDTCDSMFFHNTIINLWLK